MRDYLKVKNKEYEKVILVTIFIGIFFLAIPLDTLEIFSGFSILRILAVLPILAILLRYKNTELKINSILIILLIYVIFVFIQIFYSIYMPYTINKLATYIMYFLLLFLCTQLKYNDREYKFLERCFAYSCWTCLICILMFKYDFEGRLTISLFGQPPEDPNQFCGYFIPGIMYYTNKVISQKKYRIFNIFFIIVFLYFILLTGSRGGLIAVICGMICVIMLRKNGKELLRNIVIIAIFFIIGYTSFNIFMSFMPEELQERFAIKDAIQEGGTGRTDIWKFYLEYFNNSNLLRKIFGYGTGTLPYIYRVAHNTWIEILIESGILGVFIFGNLILKTITLLLKNKNYYFASIIISYLVLTISLSLMAYKPIWAILLMGMIYIKKEENKK